MTRLQYDSNDGCWSCRHRDHHHHHHHRPQQQEQQPDLSMTHQCQIIKNDNKNQHRSFFKTKTMNPTRLFMYNTFMVSLLLLQYIHVTTPTPITVTYCTAFMATVDIQSRVGTTTTTIPQRSLWIIDHRSTFISQPSSVYHQQPQPHQQPQQRWMSRPTTTTTTTTSISAARTTASSLVTRGKTGSRMITSIEEYIKTILKKTLSTKDNTDNYTDKHTDKLDNDNDNDDRPILLFWTAPWCGPCRLSIPIIKGIQKVYNQQDLLLTYEICTDDVMELPDMVGITSIPTIQLYYQGKLYDTIIGCVSQQVLSSSIDKVLEDVQKIKLQKQLRSMKQPITTTTTTTTTTTATTASTTSSSSSTNPLVVITTTTSTGTTGTVTAAEEYANNNHNHNNNNNTNQYNHHDFVS